MGVGQTSTSARGLQAPPVVSPLKAGLETRRRPGGLPHTICSASRMLHRSTHHYIRRVSIQKIPDILDRQPQPCLQSLRRDTR